MTLSTGTPLRDLVDLDLLDEMVTRGFVSAQTHPSRPLRIFNYTAACQYSGEWNAATLLCRGLVVNSDSGQVLARPFAKFFNYGQPGAPALDPTAPVTVFDKLDGSLGIGLRFGSSRSAFGNVIHVDLAFPLDGDRSIKKTQFVVETKSSF